MQLVLALLAALPVAQAAGEEKARSKPLLRAVDLDRGESQLVELADGTRARVKLLDVEEERDGEGALVHVQPDEGCHYPRG